MDSGLEEFGITDDAESSEDLPMVSGQSVSASPPPMRSVPSSQILEQVSLFTGLLPVHLQRISKLAQVHTYARNEHVFSHGEQSDGLYLVVTGSVRISRNVAGIGEEALAVLREGQHFGEMSLIEDDATRSADAICHERAELLKLPKNDLRDLMFVDRELAYELLWRFVRTLSGRLRDSNDRLMMLSASSRF
jgi:CRP/FNR family transcriptional regulator, cyclic AMP receptor protein